MLAALIGGVLAIYLALAVVLVAVLATVGVWLIRTLLWRG